MPRLPLLLLLWGTSSYAFPVFQEGQRQDVETAWKYLENYYNLGNDTEVKNLSGKELMAEKLKEMQQIFGLKVTGKSDPETLRVMSNPRCGVSDVTPEAIISNNPRWTKTHLTYSILNYTPLLPRAVVDQSIAKAFRVWSDVTPLTFSRVFDEEGDIVLAFYRGDHGDNNPFDGLSIRLAHAFQPGPGIGGDVHFDLDERWTDTSENFNLFYVTAHELGHSLGLTHSSDIGALMFPSYTWYVDDFVLNQEDINRIQALYGPSPNPIQPTGATTPRPCDSALTFDAITTFRGEVIFFKGRFYIRVSRAIPEPELNLIGILWPDLPGELDAVYEASMADEAYFFKGTQFWAVRGHEEQAGYPKSIHTLGFPPTVRKIDAAVSAKETKKTYFFVDDQYWRFDEQKRSTEPGFSRKVAKDFPGVDSKVDAVFEAFGFFYFFGGSSQLEFDPNAKKVTHVLKSNSWFNC
ncbi:interstitial collagenase A-like isoform X1 [Chionomys nivalis]|uniref:interstitial collagenase A-like isoform X1 n=1 Tax=Chionomys nivalis TaxID=269649 RepID=UPI0025999985|nr:interstitial collagenase A-like isoform X1 [Chionomys nivalis]